MDNNGEWNILRHMILQRSGQISRSLRGQTTCVGHKKAKNAIETLRKIWSGFQKCGESGEIEERQRTAWEIRGTANVELRTTKLTKLRSCDGELMVSRTGVVVLFAILWDFSILIRYLMINIWIRTLVKWCPLLFKEEIKFF